MTVIAKRLSEVDVAQIHQLIIEHAWRLDHGRWHDAARLYHDDACLVIGDTTLEGRLALMDWADQRAANVGRRTVHQCTNIRIESSNGDEAEGTVMLVLYVSTDSRPAEIELIGEYRDRYRRDAGGRWLFQRRAIVPIATP